MTNENLTKAKELKDNLIYYESQLEISKLNKFKDEIRFLIKAIETIKELAKELKEKIEKGCGEYLGNAGSDDMKVEIQFYCGKDIYFREKFKPTYCGECKEAIKICEDILK